MELQKQAEAGSSLYQVERVRKVRESLGEHQAGRTTGCNKLSEGPHRSQGLSKKGWSSSTPSWHLA